MIHLAGSTLLLTMPSEITQRLTELLLTLLDFTDRRRVFFGISPAHLRFLSKRRIGALDLRSLGFDLQLAKPLDSR